MARPLSYQTIADFCANHKISRSFFYNLLAAGKGPATIKLGRKTLISDSAAQAWRNRLDRKSVRLTKTQLQGA